MAKGSKQSKRTRCRKLVSRKIKKIHDDGLRGRVASADQAVAAAHAMTRKSHPECRSILRRIKKATG